MQEIKTCNKHIWNSVKKKSYKYRHSFPDCFHACLTSSCFVVFLWRQSTAYTSLSECVFMSLLFVFFSFKCFCHQLLFFFSLRNFVLTEHLAEAGGGGEECETDEERLWWPYMDNLKIVLLDAGNSSWSLFFLWWLQMKRIEESVHAVFFLCFLLQMFKTFHLTTPQSLLLPSVWSSGSALPASLLRLCCPLETQTLSSTNLFLLSQKLTKQTWSCDSRKKQLLASRPK